jgi:hypothetical protein
VNAAGYDSPICVDLATACDALDCGDDGECAILESYPAQVTCVGSGGGDGDDGDDIVCSDPDSCNDDSSGAPDSCDDGDECSVPGNPGQ